MKIKKYNKYTPQQGEIIKRTFWLPTIKEIILSIVSLGIVWFIYSTWNTQEELSKEQIDIKISERYEDIYSDNFYTDKEIIRVEEEQSMLARIDTRESEVIAKYWKEAKEEILIGFKEYVEASPEVVSFVVDFDKIESKKYSSLDDFFTKNFPTSRFIGYDIKGQCKKNNISEDRCLLLLAIAGKESKFDTAYVKNDWSPAVTEGQNRNNPFGLKANRRYIDTKCSDDSECRNKYSSIPYDGFAFIPFNTFESGLDWFMNDTLAKGYPSVTNPYQMIGYYNSNPKWADDVSHYMNILRPLLKYNK